MINNCQPEDIVPEEYATVTYSPGDRPQTNKNNNRRQVDYEEAIKVWHITDVHLEPEYATVKYENNWNLLLFIKLYL